MLRLYLIIIILFAVDTCVGQKVNYYQAYPFKLDVVEVLSKQYDFRLDSILPSGKRGIFKYYKADGNEVFINKTFQEAYSFYNKYAIVKWNNKYGIIDRKGDFVVKAKFDHFRLYEDSGDLKGVYFGMEDYFDFSTGIISNGPYYFYDPAFPHFFDYEENGKFGLIFTDSTRSKPIYDSIVYRGGGVAIVKKGNKLGAIFMNGKVVAQTNFDEVVLGTANFSMYDGITYAMRKQKEWYYFSSSRFLFKNRYRPQSIKGKFIVVETKKGFNYLTSMGAFISDKFYKWVSEFGYTAIDAKNNVIVFDKDRHEHIYYVP